MLRPVLAWSVAFLPALALAQAAAGPDATRRDPPPAEVTALLEQADAAYARRDEPGAMEELRARLDAAEKLAPADYEVLWRQARRCFWESDDPSIKDEQKSKIGKQGWDLAERAIKANPDRVEGYHYAAAGMGNYSLGIGILRALGEGIEGKFKARLSRAEQIDPGFEAGAIQTAWGRFWFKLPWPKYDARKSEKALMAALQRNPDNVRAHVYLAELYKKEKREPEARQELEKAVAGEPGRYDAPEERRWQGVARKLLGTLTHD